MADKKISELDAITGANTAATDVFVMVDTSTGQTKKITRAELNNAIERDVLSTINIDGGSGYAARTTRRQEDRQIRNIGHPNDATKRHLGTEPALGLILVQAMIAHGSLDQIVPTVGVC